MANLNEFWIPVSGYEGWYEVSNTGFVRSVDRYVNYKNGGVRFWPSKILCGHVHKAGYLCVDLKKQGERKKFQTHTIVANAFCEKKSIDTQVNHKDGNKLNNAVSNIEWCTQSENMQHAFKTNIHSGKGKTHYLAKKVRDTQTGKIYNTLKDAAAETCFTDAQLSHMLKGNRVNKTKMRYI